MDTIYFWKPPSLSMLLGFASYAAESLIDNVGRVGPALLFVPCCVFNLADSLAVSCSWLISDPNSPEQALNLLRLLIITVFRFGYIPTGNPSNRVT